MRLFAGLARDDRRLRMMLARNAIEENVRRGFVDLLGHLDVVDVRLADARSLVVSARSGVGRPDAERRDVNFVLVLVVLRFALHAVDLEEEIALTSPAAAPAAARPGAVRAGVGRVRIADLRLRRGQRETEIGGAQAVVGHRHDDVRVDAADGFSQDRRAVIFLQRDDVINEPMHPGVKYVDVQRRRIDESIGPHRDGGLFVEKKGRAGFRTPSLRRPHRRKCSPARPSTCRSGRPDTEQDERRRPWSPIRSSFRRPRCSRWLHED